MSLPQSSKEKSARIDWGHFNHPAPTTRVRTLGWLLAAIIVAVPLLVLTVSAGVTGNRPEALDAAASRGPLTAAHAGLDNQCEACHEPFERITGGNWAGDLGLVSSTHTNGVGMHNAKCQSCHAGSIHHPQVRPDSPLIQTCAGCHRDHQGRDYDLKRLTDSNCIGCHGALPDHANNPSAVQVATRITGFATDHPEFRQIDTAGVKHERKIKFSHAVHMAPGMGLANSGYTFDQITDPNEQKRYLALLGQSNTGATVELTCASCHQLSASRTDGAVPPLTELEQFSLLTRPLLDDLPKEPLQPPRQAGQYFLPINFDTHCRACHPLTFDESEGLARESVPHRKQPAELEQYLRGVYSARYIADTLADPKAPDRGTGRLDPLPDALDAAGKKKATEQIGRQIDGAMQTLFGGNKTCLECHYAQWPLLAEASSASPVPTAIVPGQIPTVWQPRARFDHSAHRAMTCQSCHPGSDRSPAEERTAATAYAAGGVEFPRYQHPPDLPSIASCRECHAPARDDAGVSVGGVRHGCTDCHSYHHADRWLQGQGSPHNNPPGGKMSLEQLLYGGRVK